jgi:hypothetical protein
VCARAHARVCKSAFAKARIGKLGCRVREDRRCGMGSWLPREGSQERVVGSPDTAILNGNDAEGNSPPFCTRDRCKNSKIPLQTACWLEAMACRV